MRRMILAGMVLVGTSCSGSGSKDSTPTAPAPVLTTVTVSISPANITVGQSATATAIGLDQNGASISVGSVSWSTGSSSIATVTASGVVTGVAPGQALIIATAGGKTGEQTITVSPPPVASVTVTPTAATLGVGSTQQLTAVPKDANGNVLTGQAIAWSTTDATKATVSQTGLVTAVALGTAIITASCGGETGNANITVAVVPVASIAVAPPTGSLVVGGTLTVTATAFDANGNVLVGQSWSWTTTNPSIVSGTFIGNVLTATGVGVGTATLTATAGGKSGSSVVTVASGATSVSLSGAGQSAVFLNSPNFAAAVTVQPGSQYLIAVVNTDNTATSLEDFTLSTTFGAVSASQVLSGPVKATLNTEARTPNASGPRIDLPSGLREQMAVRQDVARNHLAILEENRQLYSRMFTQGAFRAPSQAASGHQAPLSASVIQAIGTVNRVYVRRFGNISCNAVDSIGARTVAVGQHVIVLADTNRTTWPQAYRPDSSWYQTFANEYDQITYPHLLNYIGNPLADDANLSALGKVTVTITPLLNNIPGQAGGGSVLAFVNPCDFGSFVPSGPNQLFSNQTEMMYSYAPTANGPSVAEWEAELRATAAHESKHIVSYTDRILLGSPGAEVTWLEEGLAQVSSEIWERHFNQATWKGNATFAQTVGCEYDLAAASYPCDAANNLPFALMNSHLPFLFEYLQNESNTNSEGFGIVDGQTDYGAGWAFSRWAIDQYSAAGGEGTFIKSLINTTTTGFTNLSAQTGQSTPLLLTYWNVASAVFQTPTYTAADVRTTIPSFNFANIFQVGQTGWMCTGGIPCSFFPAPFTEPPGPVYPVAPVAFSSGTFARTVHAVPGTSASFFLLSGTTAGIETLYLLNSSGSALSPSSGFRVAILRVQ